MAFELFDPKAELLIREGQLPHWFQPGVTYFVTFRTGDSVPDDLLRGWHRRRDDWLKRIGIDPRDSGWKARLRSLPEREREYHATFTREFMEYLDRGHGACVLKEKAPAEAARDSLLHFDNDRYHMVDFVVMPNHVHRCAC